VTRHRTQRAIFLFWLPLAATWLMMASEGPFLSAIIARLPDPKFNLAAFGVSFALGILVEAPVIMLMSASTALATGWTAFVRLRRFTWALNLVSTGLLLLVVLPPVHRFLMYTVMGVPPEVADLTWGALLMLIPWPAAIGYRRFLQGLLIRTGRTRLVAYGTVIRLVAMVGFALSLYLLAGWPGAWVGTASLSLGVVAEAIAARFMAAGAIRELREKGDAVPPAPARPARSRRRPAFDGPPTYRQIASFYYPLALTSLIGLTVQPMLTFFMGRAPYPLESLAVFPVVHALSFLFRSLGLSFQEAAIALLGDDLEHREAVGRFGLVLGLGTSLALAVVAFTPLAEVWFVRVSGLDPELAAFAIWPTRILVPLPGLSVWLSYQRGVLVQSRTTGPISAATTIEVVLLACTFVIGGWLGGLVGVTAAFLAFLVGRMGANVYLLPRVRRSIREVELDEEACEA
jgi:hypothetical protein